jgi:hypothetical protein
MSFLHGAILFGLVALVIPPLIHLLNRRRFDVVDWAAMRFLQISQKTRQKIFFEQLMLMLLRVGLLAVLVLATAAPVLRLGCVAQLPAGDQLARLVGQTKRDIVLIVDGSYSMDCKWQETTAHEAAKAWARDFLEDLGPSDRVAIIQAKQRPVPVLGLLTEDSREARSKLEQMLRPRGGVNWLKAMQEALHIFDDGHSGEREIIILTDGQRQGWADPRSLRDWENLTLNLPDGTSAPRVWVVNVVPDRPDDLPNWSVSPLQANRAVAAVGREVVFKFNLLAVRPPPKIGERRAAGLTPPPDKVEFRVDEEPAGASAAPRSREPSLAMEFRRSFTSTGSHLISASIGDDVLPGDNRRDFAIDVLPAIPVLIVDGDRSGLTPSRGSDYVRLAIAPAHHPQPSFLVRTLPITEFASQSLNSPVSRDSWSLPRVLILQNVTSLTDTQHKTIEEFVGRGGGVLALPGPRCDADSFNHFGFRNGEGWLPAPLLAPAGNADDDKNAASPVADGLDRTFLDLFKDPGPQSFLKSTFSHWWKLDARRPGAGNVVARLSTGDPLFVEKTASTGQGRVLLAAVPFDDSWRTSLLLSHDFVRLCHECLFHLTGARSAEVNLQSGQEIIFRPADGEPPGGITIRLPDGSQRRLDVSSWPLVFDETRETGVYKLTTDSGRVQYYVVQPDGNESNLSACTDHDRRLVSALFPEGRFTYAAGRNEIYQSFRHNQNDPELDWLFLALVMALLAGEVALTRALVKRNPPAV